MTNRKQELIEQILNVVDPKPQNVEVFRRDDDTDHLPRDEQVFDWNGKWLTGAECEKIPAKMRIYVLHEALGMDGRPLSER